MSSKTYITYLTNGMGNRLLPLASAMAHCRLTGRQLRVYWDHVTPTGCLAPLDRLFQNRFDPITLDAIAHLGEQHHVALYSEGPDARQNAQAQGQGVLREARHFGRDALLRLSRQAPPQPAQALGLGETAEVVVAFDNQFLAGVPRSLSVQALRSLVPAADVLARVAAEVQALGLQPGMPAVHARGTDFELQGALAMYTGRIKREIGRERFYLSTEDAQLEAGLRQRFGGQMVTRSQRLHLQRDPAKTRWTDPDSYVNSEAHGVDALTDLYLLSCTRLVVHHPASTFAAVARHLHGVLQPQPAPQPAPQAQHPHLGAAAVAA